MDQSKITFYKNYKIIYERFGDPYDTPLGFPLILVHKRDNDYMKTQLTLIVLNCEEMEIRASQSVNPLRANLKDLQINDIRLCRSS